MSAKKYSIQDKMAQLHEQLAWFDGNDFELEQALARYVEAKKLADSIEQDLQHIKNDINVIKEQFDQDRA